MYTYLIILSIYYTCVLCAGVAHYITHARAMRDRRTRWVTRYSSTQVDQCVCMYLLLTTAPGFITLFAVAAYAMANN